ncbi:hypothetical protein AGLY_003563 [Aphis glycines]|uniref:Uncharacterized protein n=1 Tax=Aphis glycines TaxID=307491 RepID=A0A6G0TYP9_APHGL|nr:hypothetical protein AGLY_003563 [Aphis glycines]
MHITVIKILYSRFLKTECNGSYLESKSSLKSYRKIKMLAFDYSNFFELMTCDFLYWHYYCLIVKMLMGSKVKSSHFLRKLLMLELKEQVHYKSKHLILNIFEFIFDCKIYLRKLCGTVTVYFKYNLSPFLIFTNVMSSEFTIFISHKFINYWTEMKISQLQKVGCHWLKKI